AAHLLGGTGSVQCDVAIQLRQQDQRATSPDSRSARRQLGHVPDSVRTSLCRDQGQWWQRSLRTAPTGAARLYRGRKPAPPAVGVHQLARQVREECCSSSRYFGDGNVTSTAVASSTKAPKVNSMVAEWRIVSSLSLSPSDGRMRLQFHAPIVTTPSTNTSLTTSASP